MTGIHMKKELACVDACIGTGTTGDTLPAAPYLFDSILNSSRNCHGIFLYLIAVIAGPLVCCLKQQPAQPNPSLDQPAEKRHRNQVQNDNHRQQQD